MAAVVVMSPATSQSDSEREREGEGEKCEEAKEEGDSSRPLKTPAADEVGAMEHNEQTSHPLFVAGGERGLIFCEGKAVL